MRIRSVSFDLLSLIGAILMGACGVTEITLCMHANGDLAIRVICVGIFWFLAAMLLLMSLRRGYYRPNPNKDETENEQLTQPPVSHTRSPKMQIIQWAVWAGVICLLISTILQLLGHTKAAMRIGSVVIPLLLLASLSYGFHLLSVRFNLFRGRAKRDRSNY